MEEGLVVDDHDQGYAITMKDMIISRKTNPPPFLVKTYMLVDDLASDTIISWNESGTAFVVWQPAEFARDLLPTLFKHSNFSSFVRQLNTYGFRKVATSRWEFSNDKFQKGRRDLLSHIHRRKAWSNRHHRSPATPTAATPHQNQNNPDEDQRSLSTSSSSASEQMINTLVDENKRLKRENGVLCSELTSMKRKCRDLLDLVSVYVTSGRGREEEREERLPPKLFGVRLEVKDGVERKKRKKEEEEVFETARVLLSQSCKGWERGVFAAIQGGD